MRTSWILSFSLLGPLLAGCEEPTICSTDAVMCPDGTTVGRTGPKCEFPACPVVKPAPAKDPAPPEPVSCSADARVCSDGTVLGRKGPDCKFPDCPPNQ